MWKPPPKIPARHFPPGEQFPVKYFKKVSVLEAYEEILAEIENCNTPKSINAAYIRILIFHGSFPGSESLLTELLAAYHQKDSIINS